MTAAHMSSTLECLHHWFLKVPTQKSRHVWSVLPAKAAGAERGVTMTYTEAHDKAFMDRFLHLRDVNAFPYFDPFSHDWLPSGYFHSNMATFRKKTFINSWHAGTWHDDQFMLDPDYMNTFAEKVLKLAGTTTRLPAFATALWFYKRPQTEWPTEHPFVEGLPLQPGDVISQFRTDFFFADDAEWSPIFDEQSDLDSTLRGAWPQNA